jgi:hypothetical protein
MPSLWDVYSTLVSADQQMAEKIAVERAPSIEVAQETAKLAADYDEAGRRLARAHFSQFVSEKLAEEGHAVPFAGKETPEEEAAEEAAKKKAKKKESEKEGKSDDERKEEKTAAIAQRLVEDPDYRIRLIAKYHGQG